MIGYSNSLLCLNFRSDPCSTHLLGLTSSFTVPSLGSTDVNGSFTCSVVFFSHCCSATLKWSRGSTIINSTLHDQYKILTQYEYHSSFYLNTYTYKSTLSVNGTLSAIHTGIYHCEAVSVSNSNTISRNLTAQSK